MDSRIVATGTGVHGNVNISVVTETVVAAVPIAILLGVAVAITDIEQNVVIESKLQVAGDFGATSMVDASSTTHIANTGLGPAAVSIGVNQVHITNDLLVTPQVDSTVGGDLRANRAYD